MKKIDGVLALVLCALGWSLGGIFLKFVTINSFAIASFRSFVAFFTIVALSKRFPKFVVKNEDNTINKKGTFYLWIAAISYAVTMILFCIANKLTYAANAILLQYTNPLWIILLCPFILGEKNTKVDYLSILGIVVGMLLFFADNLFGNNSSGEFAATEFTGNILALLSGVAFAFTTIFQRKQHSDSSKDAFMISQLITFVFGLPFIFITDNGIPDLTSIIFLILLGILQMGLPNILYATGIKKVRALSASLISMIEPLMNPIWVFIFYKEKPSVFSIIGGIFIIGCIILREIFNRKFYSFSNSTKK